MPKVVLTATSLTTIQTKGDIMLDRNKIKKDLEVILEGIDQDECDSDEGWWETSHGAEFGERKLDEVLKYVDNLVADHNRGVHHPAIKGG